MAKSRGNLLERWRQVLWELLWGKVVNRHPWQTCCAAPKQAGVQGPHPTANPKEPEIVTGLSDFSPALVANG